MHFFCPLSFFAFFLIVHTLFFRKILGFLSFPKIIFGFFLSVPHLVDNKVKIVDEPGGGGRNLMCDRTLSSLLVYICD